MPRLFSVWPGGHRQAPSFITLPLLHSLGGRLPHVPAVTDSRVQQTPPARTSGKVQSPTVFGGPELHLPVATASGEQQPCCVAMKPIEQAELLLGGGLVRRDGSDAGTLTHEI